MHNKSSPKACVIGNPVQHSISPIIHSYWLKKYKIEGKYSKKKLSQYELSDFTQSIKEKEFLGCNVTIPYKEKIIPYLNRLTPRAELAQSVNTIWLENGELIGDSTDGIGFYTALLEKYKQTNAIKTVTLIGAGGAAKSILSTLLEKLSATFTLCNRNLERAEALASLFEHDIKIYPWAKLNKACEGGDFIINTTKLGMENTNLPIEATSIAEGAICYDIVYNPLETDFLKKAHQRGALAIDGLGMLMHQARFGFEKWFGILPEVDENLRQILVKELGL